MYVYILNYKDANCTSVFSPCDLDRTVNSLCNQIRYNELLVI